ncbi:hypothetical protein L6Q21_06215 [Sandaracinobacter sp. RS1-74]|uniref:hypothetical protein n=1 Tax=Sandaracinobacteroides sayramensis TaxID=2913411 RepID=UPI001EDC1D77|nr:hypothetical protein [Sandaracinobacteroides sayramensis]MCG2840572.1 hypothetical protein [Sandaracinobacteroides sayramensis]
MQTEKPQLARIALPLMAAPLFLYGAASAPASAEDKDFGCTVRRNIEVQTVNLDPRYEGTLMEGGVGVRSAAAIRRYMTDKVRPLPGASMDSAVGQQGGAGNTSGGDVTGAGK